MTQISNWDDLEKILHHAFYNELRVAPEEHPLLYAEPPLTSKRRREQITQIMFETFNVPALMICSQAALCMAAAGKTTGVAVLCGESGVTAVPVFEGSAIDGATLTMPVGGALLTNYTMQLMTERGYSFTTTAEREIVRDIKERLMRLAPDFETALADDHSQATYELPDGQVVTVGNERFRVPELLFNPAFAGVDSVGIHELVLEAVLRCDPDIRRVLLQAVVLSGRGSKFPGLQGRLQAEVMALLPADADVAVRVLAPPERGHSEWIGGSIMATIVPEAAVVTRKQYEERGPSFVHRMSW